MIKKSYLLEDEKNFIPNFKAGLQLLKRISKEKAAYDWTTFSGIIPLPPHIRNVIASVSNDIFYNLAPCYGTQDSDENLLKGIVNYFCSCSIKSSQESVVQANSVFEIISLFYQYLFHSGIKKVTLFIPKPSFGYYLEQYSLFNVDTLQFKFEFIDSSADNSYRITPKELQEAIDRNSQTNPESYKILLLTNPINPTGTIYHKEHLEAIAPLLKKENIFIISDEIFRDTYLTEKNPHCSIGSIEDVADKTLTLNGVGKSRLLYSFRISFGNILPTFRASPSSKTFVEFYEEYKQMSYNLFSKLISIEALKDNQDNQKFLAELRNAYLENYIFAKDLIKNFNDKLQERFDLKDNFLSLEIENPESTGVCLINFSGLRGFIYKGKPISSSLDMATFLYETAGVAMVPGECFFFSADEMLVRLPPGPAREKLNSGFQAMAEACIEHLKLPVKHLAPKNSNSIVISYASSGYNY